MGDLAWFNLRKMVHVLINYLATWFLCSKVISGWELFDTLDLYRPLIDLRSTLNWHSINTSVDSQSTFWSIVSYAFCQQSTNFLSMHAYELVSTLSLVSSLSTKSCLNFWFNSEILKIILCGMPQSVFLFQSSLSFRLHIFTCIAIISQSLLLIPFATRVLHTTGKFKFALQIYANVQY